MLFLTISFNSGGFQAVFLVIGEGKCGQIGTFCSNDDTHANLATIGIGNPDKKLKPATTITLLSYFVPFGPAMVDFAPVVAVVYGCLPQISDLSLEAINCNGFR